MQSCTENSQHLLLATLDEDLGLQPPKNPDRDLNPDKEYQKLLCYRYTIGVEVGGVGIEPTYDSSRCRFTVCCSPTEHTARKRTHKRSFNLFPPMNGMQLTLMRQTAEKAGFEPAVVLPTGL